MSECVDRIVGDILAGWRYDISGLAADMRSEYETHLAECAHCRSRQVLHRTIDIGLMIVATVSAIRAPPSSLTAPHWVSFMIRTADWKACSFEPS